MSFNIRNHLDKLQPTKDKNRYYCPVCEGNNLTVDPKSGAYQCWNECSCKSIRDAIAPLGDSVQSPTPRKPTIKSRQKAASNKPVRTQDDRTWVYTDAEGNPVARTRRTDDGKGKRRIWQEYPHEGLWIKGGEVPEEVKTPLKKAITPYRYLEVKQAIAEGKPIFWVEGEPCADALWAIGIPATTSIGGSKSYRRYGDYKRLMEGAEVIICPDQDQSGLKYSQDVAADSPVAKWCYPFPDSPQWAELPSSGGLDIADWIDQGATAETIQSAVTEKRQTAPTPPEDDDSEPEKLCSIAAQYQKLKATLGDRLRLNLLTKELELDGATVTLEQLELELALKHNRQFKSLPLVARGLAEEQKFSPVVEYLGSVAAKYGNDTSILSGLAQRYFGRSERIYQTFIEKWLIGAVARVYEPGCKLDTALILQGGQGIGKSTFFKILASEPWFDDSFGSPSDKDERLKLHRAWVIEWSELETVFKRRDIAAVKAFLSSSTDHVRPPYGRSVECWHRQGVIVGTTNQDEFLSDTTGNRRFWVIPVRQTIDTELLRVERDRIWAAAVALYQSGRAWWLTAEEDREAAAIAEEHQLRDPWFEPVERYLRENFKRQTTTAELLTSCLQIEIPRQERGQQMRIADILKQLGWEQKTRHHDGKRQRVWIEPTESQPSQPRSEVVTEVVTPETPSTSTFQHQNHNHHNLNLEKTSHSSNGHRDQGEEESGCEDQDLLPSEVVMVVTQPENAVVARNSRSTTPSQPDSKVVTSLPEVVTVKFQVGDRVMTPKGKGTITQIDFSWESNPVRVEVPGNFLGWLEPEDLKPL